MYREIGNNYYDLESGPHRTRLLERDFGLAQGTWVTRAIFRLGIAAVPIVLIALAIEALKLFGH